MIPFALGFVAGMLAAVGGLLAFALYAMRKGIGI